MLSSHPNGPSDKIWKAPLTFFNYGYMPCHFNAVSHVFQVPPPEGCYIVPIKQHMAEKSSFKILFKSDPQFLDKIDDQLLLRGWIALVPNLLQLETFPRRLPGMEAEETLSAVAPPSSISLPDVLRDPTDII